MTHFLDEYERYGFRPAAIVELLSRHGIPTDLQFDAASAPAWVDPPDWKRIMALEPSLPLFEWVCAFIGLDPYDSQFMPDEAQADFKRYEDLLTRAIARDELPATEGTTARGDTTWQIAAQALSAWCLAKGVRYPLPSPVAAVTSMPPRVVEPIAGRWPWGDHSTKALELLADAARQWWTTYDPAEPNTAPTNREVVDYLMQKGASQKLAESMASILRADDLQTGRRKGSTE